MANFNGQGGNVTYNGVVYSVKEWSFEDASDAINCTSTGSGGFKVKISAPRGGSGSFTIILDAAALPNGLQSGESAAATFTKGNSGSNVTCTSVLITKAAFKNPAEEDVELECSYETTGSYSIW